MFKLVLEKAETRDQIANIHWIIEKAREFQENIYFCFIDYAKAFDCVDHNKQWKILKEMGIPDHLTCLLRNLYAGQEATWPAFGEGNGNPLQYSCPENPMGGGAWWAAVHGVAASRTQLSNFTFTFHFHALEKEMATHSSVLTWRIPGTVEPGGLPSMGSHRVRHDWSDLAAAAAASSMYVGIHLTVFWNFLL